MTIIYTVSVPYFLCSPTLSIISLSLSIIYLCIHVSIYLSIDLSIIYVYLIIYLSLSSIIYLSHHLFTYLSSIYLSIIYLSLLLSLHNLSAVSGLPFKNQTKSEHSTEILKSKFCHQTVQHIYFFYIHFTTIVNS
jgi:hypothetical protein